MIALAGTTWGWLGLGAWLLAEILILLFLKGATGKPTPADEPPAPPLAEVHPLIDPLQVSLDLLAIERHDLEVQIEALNLRDDDDRVTGEVLSRHKRDTVVAYRAIERLRAKAAA